MQYVCTTCGTQYPSAPEAPERCLICDEERQYVNPNGQSWTTLEALRESKTYSNEIKKEEDGLYSLSTRPRFAIGQTAYLVQAGGFHLLWDCVAYLDEHTLQALAELGGVDAIAISHPHYYTTHAEWAKALGVPVYLHVDDRQWAVRQDSSTVFWSGEKLELAPGLALHRLGGHFDGGTVAHWEQGNDGKGVLLTGDIIQVVQDRRWVSFMYSYPNLIPLPAFKVKRIADKVRDLPFDRIYNAFNRMVKANAAESVQRSAARYIQALEGKHG
ncbi:MBL fold metallo-hydrolase [Paenibacillus nanensis]|uniref:MBL fold metallo-hydrolase n=1 Tax=Paenibacillus nanensis TaxID=393251 RepID=A0A3A1UPD0_9BACL|nr:MBL fold metallo-hydrolase [Paenibacillus nanensis]RIX50105.1 MBL fold metallo-hydrolase [Paenibacillus nanensis]